jgi:predicted  nucleic acid-binding Zn-ribbon protein
LNDNKILIEKLRNEVNENKKEINENKTLIDKLKEQKLKLEIEINKNKETIEKLEKNIPDKEGYENELN